MSHFTVRSQLLGYLCEEKEIVSKLFKSTVNKNLVAHHRAKPSVSHLDCHPASLLDTSRLEAQQQRCSFIREKPYISGKLASTRSGDSSLLSEAERITAHQRRRYVI